MPQRRLPSSRGRRVLVALGIVLTGCATTKPLMAVNVSLTDLRSQPHTVAAPVIHDPLEETQLLYGELVTVVKTQEGWSYVEAIEQPERTHENRWQGYPGWVPTSALTLWQPLMTPTIIVTERWAPTWRDSYRTTSAPWHFSLGTRLRATDMAGQLWKVELLNGETVWMLHKDAQPLGELMALPNLEKRRAILRHAQLFLGDPYYWGGRSPHTTTLNDQVTGVDCSGLVNLAYRAAGVDIPRDAHEQFLRAKPVKAVQPGDLIFLSERHNPKHISHVMLYAGDGEVIEAPGTGLAVRRIALKQRLGQSLDWLAPGAVVEDQTLFFGTYLQ